MAQCWYESYDEQGSPYYYNAETEECAWELPPGAAVASQDDPSPADSDLSRRMQKAFEGKLQLLDRGTQLSLEAARRKQQARAKSPPPPREDDQSSRPED